jgi:hypothetical protein
MPSKRGELKIDIPLAFLLTLAQLLYPNLGFSNGKLANILIWVFCGLLLLRIGWLYFTQGLAQINFKNAAEFTWWRRLVIRYDIGKMHTRLTRVGIPTPKDIPPFTVHDEGQAMFTPPHLYRREIRIPRPDVRNRKVVTHLYATYVVMWAFPDAGKEPSLYDSPTPEKLLQLSQTIFFVVELRKYFQASYWNSVEEAQENPGAMILWRIREAFNQEFADTLASKVLQVAADSPQEVYKQNWGDSLYCAIRIAVGLIEADSKSWPKIQQILKDNPIRADNRIIINPPENRSAFRGDMDGQKAHDEQVKVFSEMYGPPGESVPEADADDLKAVWRASEEIQKDHPGEHVGIDMDSLSQFCKPGANMSAVCYRSMYLDVFRFVAGMPRSSEQEMTEPQKKVAAVLKDGVTDEVVNAVAKVPMKWDMHGLPLDVDEFLKRCA